MSSTIPKNQSNSTKSNPTSSITTNSIQPEEDLINSLKLTPLRAHYLKRELVTLEFLKELTILNSPESLSLLGKPFLPRSRFSNGFSSVPLPSPPPGSTFQTNQDVIESEEQEGEGNLPFLTFVLNHFILSFPFLINCPDSFFSHKLQPFIYSFLARNISTSDEGLDESNHLLQQQQSSSSSSELLVGGIGIGGEGNKRKKLAGKVEKHLGLVMSSAIKLVENDGKEEIVRINEEGNISLGLPITQQIQKDSTIPPTASSSKLPSSTSNTSTTKPKVTPEEEFNINIVSIRNITTKGLVRNKTHEEFIIRTRRKGEEELFVTRRYGDFVRLADTLRQECVEEEVHSPPAKDRRVTEVRTTSTTNSSPESSRTSTPQSTEFPTSNFDSPPIASTSTSTNSGKNSNRIPSLARERNRLTLRSYLRSFLTNPILSNSQAFQSFLLESPINLTEIEMKDIKIREEMDQLRESESLKFQDEVNSRVKELEGYLKGFKEDLVRKDGLTRIFGTIRVTKLVEDLPIEYRKVLEWARISLASTIYTLFLGSDTSSSTLTQLKRLHSLTPYFLLRSILRISNPISMIRAVLDLFLARPFGSTSLLQRMFTSGMLEEVKELDDVGGRVRNKIGNEILVGKVEEFVEMSREDQDELRKEALSENQNLMTLILRTDTSTSPSLPSQLMQKVQIASMAYTEYLTLKQELLDSGELSEEDSDEFGPDENDWGAWLFEDLWVLERVLKKKRDKEMLVELIFEGSTSELLKDLITIFYEPLAKVYKAANIADSLSDLQIFVNDLIKTVEFAEEANLSEPQKTVQIFIDLVARHESRFYHFVHQVHSKGEGLFDNLMKWIELFINFIRDGLPSPVSLEFLLPHQGEERRLVLKEVDEMINYHRLLKLAHHNRLKKRLIKSNALNNSIPGGSGNSNKTLEEMEEENSDTAFVNGVMENLNMGSVMGDVADVAAEDEESDSDDDDEFEDGTSSIEEEDDETEQYRFGNEKVSRGGAGGGEGEKSLPPVPGNFSNSSGLLEPIRSNSNSDNNKNKNKKKKDKIIIEPPKLVLIPKLVPLFVELVRGELESARRVIRRGSS